MTISDDSTTDTIHIFAENILVNVDNIKILESIDDEIYKMNAITNLPKNVFFFKLDQVLNNKTKQEELENYLRFYQIQKPPFKGVLQNRFSVKFIGNNYAGVRCSQTTFPKTHFLQNTCRQLLLEMLDSYFPEVLAVKKKVSS